MKQQVKKEIIKTIRDSVNHTRFPKEDHLPDWARRDNKVTKGDRIFAFRHFANAPEKSLLV